MRNHKQWRINTKLTGLSTHPASTSIQSIQLNNAMLYIIQ